MSDESDQEVLNRLARKGKRHAPRIEDSGSDSSDSSFERRKKRKRVLRVVSDAEASVSDTDSPLEKPASKKRVPRVMSDEEGSSGDSDAGSDWDGTSAEEDEEEGMENGSEDDSQSSGEEIGSSSCSDWESDTEELNYDVDSTSLATTPTSSTSCKKEKKVSEEAAGSSSSAAQAAAAYMSDSSDGQSEKCPICLLTFTTQEIGTPESCDHSFCVDCLQEWSKNVNTCPVDRQVFTLILVRRSLEGKVIRKIPVEPPRQQDEEEVQEDPTYCEVCGECDREDRMLLCDGCDLGYHLECLDPPMDTVPLEEWFCPDCTMSGSIHLAEEVDIQDGELMDLLEDAYVANMPVRPRMSRLLPRTRQSERVRATMMTRQRQRNQARNREPVQPSTSSGFDSLEADSNASVTSTRRRTTSTIPKKTTRKRRKTTRRKTTKRKKRRKTTKKTKSTSLSANSSKEVSKRRQKKRRKVKRKKRKTSVRKARRPLRIAVPHSVKGRLAEHLGVCPPRRPGQTIPDVRPRTTTSRIDFQRSRAGIPTLHLFGQRDQLDYFSSGSDHEDTYGGGGDTVVIARPRTLSARSASSIISRKRVFPSTSRSLAAIQSAADSNSDKSSCDLIGSILNSQAVWHSKKSVVTINRDGSLQIKSDGDSGTPKRSKEDNSSIDSDDRRTDEGIVRTDDRLSRISNSDAPVNVSEAGSSTSGHITQAPMYPGRGGGGSARPPPSGNFQQFGGSRYSSSPSYHGYQSGRGYSNFSPSSNFDSRGARAGYANFLNSGPPPPPPFRGGLPLRFRMAPRFPIRRPLLPPVRPQLQQQTQSVQQIPPSGIEEFQPEDDAPDCQKTSRPDEEDEEIDIYSDIEVGGGSGSGGPGGGGSEPDEGDRSLELAYEALQPPPIPPAMLMGMGGDAMSDEEPGSDSELVIDDNITPSSPPDNSEKYDPEADTEEDKPDLPEIPESEKYDPAEPSNDTDDEEEVAAAATATAASASVSPDKVVKATEALSISVPETCSLSNVAHSSSNSNASYLHSPTYGDSSTMIGSDIKLSSDAGVGQEKLDRSSVNRKLERLADEPSERHSVADEDEDEEDEECPNFSIYSATSMDIARRTGEDEDIPITKADAESPETVEDSRVESKGEKEVKGTNEDKDENSNISVLEKLVNEEEEEEEEIGKEQLESIAEDRDLKSPTEPEEGELSEKRVGNSDLEEEDEENDDDDDDDDDDEPKNNEIQVTVDNEDLHRQEQETEQEPEAVEGVKKLSLVEEIFGSDDNDSLIGGATSAVSAATVDNAPQASVTPLGLEGLDTETISETEEAINFEDDLSQDDGFLTAEEDGEIPSVKRKKKKKSRKASTGGSVGEEAGSAKDHTPPEPIDYEEGEIVDDKPKQHEPAKKDKKASDKKDKSKYDKDGQKSTDENFDITGKSKISEDDRKKKKKKSSGDKSRGSKERAVLSSSENKDKNKDKASKVDDSNIAWKKLSKSSKERNYRDTKGKPDADPSKTKDAGKKKDTAGKDTFAKKDKKKKEKRKDMERYDVRKIVSDKKRKRRDAFGRDLSRERSYSRSLSRSRGRSYDRSRGRSRSVSRSRVTRSRGRTPVKSRIRSRSRSRLRSRSRSRNRSRSRSKPRSKIKSKDRLRKSRSKDKQRSRVSRSRSRGRRSRSRTRSRSRNRSRLRSRSRSPVRSRDRRDRRGSQKCRYRERRSWSHSWTPSWSRSRSVSCSSYSRSRTPTPRRFNRTYSRSFSRSWSRERHERIPLLEKKTGAISKTAKKLTVIVSNTKDDSERHRKKEKKRKEAKKNKEVLAALEKRKKRKEKSPAPSKEVFTSGDNILVSVNFKSNKSTTSKDISLNSGAIAGPVKEAPKRKHDGSFEMEREPAKKIRKEKGNKDKGSPRQKNGISSEKVIVRTGEKKSKKGAQKAGNKASRVAALVNKKPVAIIDLDQSPFHEQTPSPTDLIVLSDSDEEGMNKENDREEESLNSLRNLRPSSSSPKTSSKQAINAVPGNALVRTPESQSPPMNAVGSYLVTSTGPKTPPEPQIKFSIAAKPQLRSINNPLREDEEDLLAEEAGLDDLHQRIEEELDRGLDRGLGEMHHKGPNTPPEPRGPTTPCSPPTSPDAYDPFDPTKSGTPSPVGAGASMDGPPSPAHTPTEQLLQLAVINRESPMVSDLEDLASKSLEARVTTPTMPSTEEVADQSSQSPERSKLSVRGDTTMASSPSILPETSLPPPVSSDNEISQPAETSDGGEKSKQMSLSLPPPGPAASDPNATTSPERSIPVVITSQPQSIQATPVKPLFPNSSVKQVVQQQPVTSTPTHSTAPAPVFPTLTPANIASILCTPPPAALPLSRMALFNAPTMSVPQLMVQQQPQPQQQQQVPHLLGSPVIVPQRPPPPVVRTTPEKLPTPAKLTPVRTNTVQNGEQSQSSQKQAPDTSTDVVDMDLESPYSPGSSEGDDLFDPPAEIKSNTSTSFGNRTVPLPTKNAAKLPLPLVAMLHKSPSKPPQNQDKFDTLFGLSPLRANKTAPARTTSKASKAHHAKAIKAKNRAKAGKREIAIKMDEDQLQILDDLPSSAVELQVKDKFLKKLNRQERVVEEVKLSLKPHYTKKHITKEEYKEILRRSVPKICHNKSGEINPLKIGTLVHAYVKKYRYAAKKKNALAAAAGKTTKPNKTTMWS